ncbi:hypothetical protein GALMADRAFT_137830 [Galerina marginata CBS 339.88]|uniref:Uncharacterized protein n=1 Tax=Galerina marginata (strain CBS 339.88) TaxID=685588 RepID=A0A067T6L4_GALM3|nr:hypothetical protein GALMADRAFT_137830 [Galerina marginata CBS 339.88]
MKFALASVVVFIAALATSVVATEPEAYIQAREPEINHREVHGYLDIALNL